MSMKSSVSLYKISENVRRSFARNQALIMACFLPLLTLLSLLLNPCSCYNPRPNLFSFSKTTRKSTRSAVSKWSPAGATWYGSPIGAGSDGGACGYLNAVGYYPFSSMISAGGPSLFKSGRGCGACYQVKCTRHDACSGNPVTVVITDECPGGPCTYESHHFDLSGKAFGAMAKPGRADQLRNAGDLQIEYKRVACHYPGVNLAFQVDSGSNPYYLACAIKYVQGDGDLANVEIKQPFGLNTWLPMQHSWGSVWQITSGTTLKGPFSFRLTTLTSRKTLVANNVIPVGWQSSQTYQSIAKFN